MSSAIRGHDCISPKKLWWRVDEIMTPTKQSINNGQLHYCKHHQEEWRRIHGTWSRVFREHGILHRFVKTNSTLLTEVLSRYLLFSNKRYLVAPPLAMVGTVFKRNFFISPALLLSDLWGKSKHRLPPGEQDVKSGPFIHLTTTVPTWDPGTFPSNICTQACLSNSVVHML